MIVNPGVVDVVYSTS